MSGMELHDNFGEGVASRERLPRQGLSADTALFLNAFVRFGSHTHIPKTFRRMWFLVYFVTDGVLPV
jgi:hypothetical protein